MRHGLNILVLFVIGAALVWQPLYAEKKTLDVRDVTFEGNHVYSRGDLLKLMVSRPSNLFHSNEFRQQVFEDDLQNIVNFYHDNGYLQAHIMDTHLTADSADEAVDIRIRLFEGVVTKLDSIAVDGNKAFADSVLLDRVDLKAGEHLQTQKIHDGMLSMATLYADSGYLSAAIKPEASVDSNVHVASLSFHTSEGTRYSIAGIVIRGLERTNEQIVQRELLFHEGEVVNYADLLESQRRLYLTGLFESVFVRPDSAEDPTKKTIVVEVKEKLAGEFNLGISYGSVEKVRGKVKAQTSNLAGTGRQLGSTVALSFIQQRVEGSFSEPWTFGTRWRTDLNTYLQYDEQPGYDIRRYGGTATVGHLLGRRSNVSLTYRYENGRLSNVMIMDSLVQNFDPKIRSLMLTYKLDNRDDPFNTTAGAYYELNNELAGAFLQGNNTFVRIMGRVKYFYSFDQETVLGTAFQAGWMHAFGNSVGIPLSERFFAGGPNALRSFDYQRIGPLDASHNPLGGTVQIIWNLAELRRAIYKFFGAVAFVDVGQVWGSPRDIHLKDVRISVGPGLRVNTPLGMVRLDYGFNFFSRPGEVSGKLFFSMGQAF